MNITSASRNSLMMVLILVKGRIRDRTNDYWHETSCHVVVAFYHAL